MLNVLGLIIDLALIAVLALILFINTKRGFLYSVTVLTGKFVSIFLAFFLSKYAKFIFTRPIGALWAKTGKLAETLPWVADILCVILAFILCVIVIRIIFRILASATSNIDGKLGKINHVLGFVLGLAIAFVVVQIIAVVIYLVGLVMGIFTPDMGWQLTEGARFTRWVFDHNVLIDLFKSILGSVFHTAGDAISSIGM